MNNVKIIFYMLGNKVLNYNNTLYTLFVKINSLKNFLIIFLC